MKITIKKNCYAKNPKGERVVCQKGKTVDILEKDAKLLISTGKAEAPKKSE